MLDASLARGQALDDPTRLAALARTGLMDSDEEEVFDRLTRLAARLLGTPLAFMTLLDDERQYFKSAHGLDDGTQPLPAAASYCQYVVRADAPFAVEDLRHDERVADPSGLLENDLLAYCGVPLTDADGNTLGSLCAIDTTPHAWSAEDLELLRELAAAAMAEIELRRAHLELETREMELQNLEHRFRHTFNAAPIGMTMIATDRTLIDANRAFCTMLGYDREELLGRTLEHVTHPEDTDNDLAAGRAMAAGEIQSYTVEKRYLRRDGGVVIVELSASAVRDEDGATQYFVVHTLDVTARHEIEQRHARLLGNLPDTMVVLFDHELRVMLMQGGLIAEREMDASDCLGRTLSDVFPDGQPEVLTGLIERALGGESMTVEHPVAGGRHLQIEFAPDRQTDGTITGAFTVCRDITTRIERERENRMLATLVQQSADAILAKDLDGRIIEWSGAAERVYGYTREEAVGRLIRELIIPPEFRQKEIDDREHVRRGGSMHTETVRRRKDGKLINIALTLSPLRNAEGRVTGTAMITRDITERIREQESRRAVEEQLRVTVEHAPIGVALIDLQAGPHGRLRSVNAAFGALLGDPDPVTAGLSLTSIVHPDDADALRDDLMLLAADDLARIETEVRCLHPGGHVVWLLLTGAAVPSGDGAPHLAVVHALDIGERKRFEGQLQHLADHDALTGLFNRRRFEQELARTVSFADRYNHSSALFMIDLDGFKGINDSMGHSFGDEVLTRVAVALRSSLRETDVLARLGGDEFAVIVSSVQDAEAQIVAEKLLDAIRTQGTVVSEHRHASVTPSIGVARVDREQRLDPETVLAQADSAMYAAKQAGRNQIAYAEPGQAGAPRLITRRSWLERLRRAIDQDRFELHAQPVVGLDGTGRDFHELLLRMRGEDGELLMPGTFLYNAERFDLIQELDRWVFGQALTLISRHAAAGSDISLSVNVSAKTLGEADLIERLAGMLAACPIPRDRLIVEVTETGAIVNIERAREIARALKAMGIRFALDDFGAGFASFYYLKHLEFDIVKIDGEFIKGLSHNTTDQLVVRSVVELARGLGAETVAEFVGDADTLRRLRELGVDYGQGYFLGRPEPVSTLLATPPLTLIR